MFRAIFFDFNGVVVDDEPYHLASFQYVLKEQGVELSRETYYSHYLGMDDHDCLQAAARDQNKVFSEALIEELIAKKAIHYEQSLKNHVPFVPGVIDFIRKLEQDCYLAVVSGALRREIEMLLTLGNIRDCFNVIVAAEDVQHGKPSPEGYQKAFDSLNRDYIPQHQILLPSECLVIEDSIWGIQAAQAADMAAVAVTTSYAQEDLPGALEYVKDFTEIEVPAFLEALYQKI
jgi:beta-phosphoglucomutase